MPEEPLLMLTFHLLPSQEEPLLLFKDFSSDKGASNRDHLHLLLLPKKVLKDSDLDKKLNADPNILLDPALKDNHFIT